MQQKVYKHHVKDISELRERIVATWDELDQRIIDTTVGQWNARLRACVKALGGHTSQPTSGFEERRKFSQLGPD